MATRRNRIAGPGTCAYCAEDVDSVEQEHVFPRSWYPDGTAPSSMLVVPACVPCNRRLGVLEERLRINLVAGLSADEPASRGVAERALRSIDDTRATGVKQLSHRAAKRRAISKRITVVPSLGSTNTLWTSTPPRARTIRTPAGLVVHGLPAIKFPLKDVQDFGEKLIRGCYFHLTERALPADTECTVVVTRKDPRRHVREWVTRLRFTRTLGCPPGFEFRAFVRQRPTTTMWIFRLWQTHTIFGWTLPDPSLVADV